MVYVDHVVLDKPEQVRIVLQATHIEGCRAYSDYRQVSVCTAGMLATPLILDWGMWWEAGKYACAHDKHTVHVCIVILVIIVVVGSKHYD